MRRILIAMTALTVCVVLAAGLLGCKKGEYVGSTMSNKYHDPSCMWAEELDRDRQVWFETQADAEAAGYVPCETCLPELQDESETP